jgi:hypothetical protein
MAQARDLPPWALACCVSSTRKNIPEVLHMGNRRRLLLIDDDPAHAKVFREAILDANDGPFEGPMAQSLKQRVVA